LLTLEKPLEIMLPRVLPPGLPAAVPLPPAVPLHAPPPLLVRYCPLWRDVDSRAAWRSAAAISRACCAWLARMALPVLRELRAVRSGVGSGPSCE
jgi:hypothetical protein